MVTRLVRTLVLAVWEFKIDVYLYLMFQEARLRDYSDEKVCTDTCFIKVTNESINYQQQFFCIVFAAAAVVFPLLRRLGYIQTRKGRVQETYFQRLKSENWCLQMWQMSMKFYIINTDRQRQTDKWSSGQVDRWKADR